MNALTQRTTVATSGSAFTTAASAGTTAWGYNPRGEVITADAPATVRDFGYSYDPIGNRLRSSRNSTNPAAATGANLGIYRQGAAGSNEGGNALNQYGVLELYGTTALANTHDDDGNQIQGRFPTTPSSSTAAGNVRVWDGENRLISTTVNSAAPVSYTYDAFHRRVAIRAGTTTTYTLYDGWNPISEYTTSSTAAPTLRTSYTWGPDLSGTFQGAGGVGGLLAVKNYTSPHAGTFYPTYDGNGNVSEYLNSSGSSAIAHYEYGPFGEQTFITGTTLAASFRHRFSTKPLDAGTGYYYYGYRYYDPLSGRWPSRDPVDEQGGLNLFAVLDNACIDQYDILGLQFFDPAPSPPKVSPQDTTSVLTTFSVSFKETIDDKTTLAYTVEQGVLYDCDKLEKEGEPQLGGKTELDVKVWVLEKDPPYVGIEYRVKSPVSKVFNAKMWEVKCEDNRQGKLLNKDGGDKKCYIWTFDLYAKATIETKYYDWLLMKKEGQPKEIWQRTYRDNNLKNLEKTDALATSVFQCCGKGPGIRKK